MLFADQEPAILDRLRANLPTEVLVQSLARIDDAALRLPAVLLTFGGGSVRSQHPQQATIDQTWQVTLAIATGAALSKDSRVAASPILRGIATALMGFKPGQTGSALSLSDVLPPDYSSKGRAYFTLEFAHVVGLQSPPTAQQ